jgi:acyl-CoA dehydrogenase
MYIASATVNRYVAAADRDDDALFEWSMREALWQGQEALDGVIRNLPNRFAAAIARVFVFPLGRRFRPPSDRLTFAAGQSIVDGRVARLRLTRDMFVPERHEAGLGRLEHALELATAVEPFRAKVREAQRHGALPDVDELALLDAAVAHGLLTSEQRNYVRDAIEARDEATRVDDYDGRDYVGGLAMPFTSTAAPTLPRS